MLPINFIPDSCSGLIDSLDRSWLDSGNCASFLCDCFSPMGKSVCELHDHSGLQTCSSYGTNPMDVELGDFFNDLSMFQSNDSSKDGHENVKLFEDQKNNIFITSESLKRQEDPRQGDDPIKASSTPWTLTVASPLSVFENGDLPWSGLREYTERSPLEYYTYGENSTYRGRKRLKSNSKDPTLTRKWNIEKRHCAIAISKPKSKRQKSLSSKLTKNNLSSVPVKNIGYDKEKKNLMERKRRLNLTQEILRLRHLVLNTNEPKVCKISVLEAAKTHVLHLQQKVYKLTYLKTQQKNWQVQLNRKVQALKMEIIG